LKHIKFKKTQADTIKLKKNHKQVIIGVFDVIDQNGKIFPDLISGDLAKTNSKIT